MEDSGQATYQDIADAMASAVGYLWTHLNTQHSIGLGREARAAGYYKSACRRHRQAEWQSDHGGWQAGMAGIESPKRGKIMLLKAGRNQNTEPLAGKLPNPDDRFNADGRQPELCALFSKRQEISLRLPLELDGNPDRPKMAGCTMSSEPRRPRL